MTWTVAWAAMAERDLLELPWRLAARVDAEVMAFADGRSGGASVERMAEGDRYRLRLRLRGASALLWIEPGARLIHVARVLRNT
jgi:hypothetical protein